MQWEGDLWAKTRWTRAPRAWGGQGATFRPLGRKGGWRWEQAGLRDRSVGRGGARAGVGAETGLPGEERARVEGCRGH